MSAVSDREARLLDALQYARTRARSMQICRPISSPLSPTEAAAATPVPLERDANKSFLVDHINFTRSHLATGSHFHCPLSELLMPFTTLP